MSQAKQMIRAVTGLAVVAALAGGFMLRGNSGDSGDGMRPVALRASAGDTPLAEPAPAEDAPSEQPTITAQPTAGRPITADPQTKPREQESIPPDADGCDHNYGKVPLCVPWAFPQGFQTSPAKKCEWLKNHDFDRIPITGVDRQGLDPDRNGVACDQ
jgi:hypothetical protein